MSNFTVESKSQLAKLLATENLTIQHQKISTARFDPKNRVLYCPIWQDMSGDMYDLLLGHEVGHALETPAEGWHDAVVDKSKGKHYKHFLNVVEDARIEKKMKRRYPGIRPSFISAYKKLIDRDFFGLKGRSPNSLPFIDRLNLFTKGGAQWGITFTDEEQKLVDRVEAAETWQDVLTITDEVYDYSKGEQQLLEQMFKFEMSPQDMDDSEFDEDMDDFDGGEYGEPQSSQESPEQEETETGESDEKSEEQDSAEEDASQSVGEKRDVDANKEGENSDKESSNEKTEADKEDEKQSSFDRHKNSNESFDDQYEPECSTDEAFRQNESSLLDAKCKEFVYIELPKPRLNDIVTPYKRVHELLEVKFAEYAHVLDGKKLYNEFKTKNDRYISLLAKEFEMKKAARAYSKTKSSNTGDIDISRLWKYQIDDTIFKKLQRTPKGKSHGLVILLDRSGSMSGNMAGSIEQIMILASFCRKVNIPFVVYGFGDANEARRVDVPSGAIPQFNFSRDLNQMDFSPVYLREYINSRMQNSEFTRCMRNLASLKKAYMGGRMSSYLRPTSEHLSNTPLVQAMVALKPLTDEFRKVNNLDLVNLCVVNDGDADTINSYFTMRDGMLRSSYFETSRYNVVLRDRESKFEMLLPTEDQAPTGHWDDALRYVIFEWFRKTTGCKIFGFYIAGEHQSLRNAMVSKYVFEDGKTIYDKLGIKVEGRRYYSAVRPERSELTKDLAKTLTKDKFLVSHNRGYNSFFVIPGGQALDVQNEELQVEGNVTARKLQTAFLKASKAKQVNRVLVTRFIDGIAA